MRSYTLNPKPLNPKPLTPPLHLKAYDSGGLRFEVLGDLGLGFVYKALCICIGALITRIGF